VTMLEKGNAPDDRLAEARSLQRRATERSE
jgi:hypothetical protein